MPVSYSYVSKPNAPKRVAASHAADHDKLTAHDASHHRTRGALSFMGPKNTNRRLSKKRLTGQRWMDFGHHHASQGCACKPRLSTYAPHHTRHKHTHSARQADQGGPAVALRFPLHLRFF